MTPQEAQELRNAIANVDLLYLAKGNVKYPLDVITKAAARLLALPVNDDLTDEANRKEGE